MTSVCAICGESFWEEVGYPKLDPSYSPAIVLCKMCHKHYKMLAAFAKTLGSSVTGATILNFMAIDYSHRKTR